MDGSSPSNTRTLTQPLHLLFAATCKQHVRLQNSTTDAHAAAAAAAAGTRGAQTVGRLRRRMPAWAQTAARAGAEIPICSLPFKINTILK